MKKFKTLSEPMKIAYIGAAGAIIAAIIGAVIAGVFLLRSIATNQPAPTATPSVSATGTISANATSTLTPTPTATSTPIPTDTSTSVTSSSPTDKNALFVAHFNDPSNWTHGGWTASDTVISSDGNGTETTSPANYTSPANFKILMHVQFNASFPDLMIVTRSSFSSNGTAVEINNGSVSIDGKGVGDVNDRFNLTQPFDLTITYNRQNVTVTFQQGSYKPFSSTTSTLSGGSISLISRDSSMQISSFEVQRAS